MKIFDEHNCEAMKNQSVVAISKREINSKVRWYWEKDIKGRIYADEIKFCPYCGEALK